MDTKEEIAALALKIGRINSRISDKWLEVQDSVAGSDGRDATISALNDYFRLKDKLEQSESRLRSVLHTHYPNTFGVYEEEED